MLEAARDTLFDEAKTAANGDGGVPAGTRGDAECDDPTANGDGGVPAGTRNDANDNENANASKANAPTTNATKTDVTANLQRQPHSPRDGSPQHRFVAP